MAHKARKRFGQNFLQDTFFQQQILGALHIEPQDHWVEIGPGQGAITDHLAAKTHTLDAVELDRDLVKLLTARYAKQAHVTIHSHDALTFNFTQWAEQHRIRLVGNLPYNISTPLIFKLLEQRACLQDAHFLLQKEVVDRLAATPGHKTYGKLSVIIQQAFQVTALFTIPPEAFQPQPKVQSSFIRLSPYLNPPVAVSDQATFIALVKQAFAQKRKTLRNNLKTLFSDDALLDLGIRPDARAETLSLQQFADLANALTPATLNT